MAKGIGIRVEQVIRHALQRAASNRRHHCPDCGGATFLDQDQEWGLFGSRHCSECDWEEHRSGHPPSSAEIERDPRLPILGHALTQQLLLAERMRHGYSPFSREDIMRCEQLRNLGYLVMHLDENGVPFFLPRPGTGEVSGDRPDTGTPAPE